MVLYYFLKFIMVWAGKTIARGCVWFFAARGCYFCEHHGPRPWPYQNMRKHCVKKCCKTSVTRPQFERRKVEKPITFRDYMEKEIVRKGEEKK